MASLVFVIKGEGNIAGNRVGEQEVVLQHGGTALTHGSGWKRC